MLADLHIHSKYSSHALYVGKSKIIEKFASEYGVNEIFDEKPTITQKVLIDGTSHIRDILKRAKKRGLKCIAITDHNTTVGNLEAQKLAKKFGIIVVPAMELSTDSGELLCYGITSKVPKGLPIRDAIDMVHQQGGVVAIAHPYNPKHPNIDFARVDRHLFKSLNIDAIEVYNQLMGKVDSRYVELARKLDVAIIGGSDAHILYQIGKGVTIFPNSVKTAQDVIEAIKNKQTYVGGNKINALRVIIDMVWAQTLGRILVNRKWGKEV
jgi:predicted metal-dependent phosphoesterase TrpH